MSSCSNCISNDIASCSDPTWTSSIGVHFCILFMMSGVEKVKSIVDSPVPLA